MYTTQSFYLLTGIKALPRTAANQAACEGNCGLSLGTFPASVAFEAAGWVLSSVYFVVGTGSDNTLARKGA